MKRKNSLNNKGFSLVELIIVIAIMAILIGVMAPNLLRYLDKSKESKRLANADAFRRSYDLVTTEVIADGKTKPSDGTGVINIIDGALKPQNAYNEAIKDALDATFTSDYGEIDISVKYDPATGAPYEMYLLIADGNKSYQYGYVTGDASLLLGNGFTSIKGSNWYRKDM